LVEGLFSHAPPATSIEPLGIALRKRLKFEMKESLALQEMRKPAAQKLKLRPNMTIRERLTGVAKKVAMIALGR
jgi:hypothetical protein